MSEDSVAVIASLTADVEALQQLDLTEVGPRALLGLMRDLEVARRRLDAATDGLVDRCDTTASFVEDGHRSTKAAVKHLGRLPGREAHGRVQTARALRCLPSVAAAYAAGDLPTDTVRAIARVASNPRVAPFLPVADAIFAEQAATQNFDSFRDWLRRWEALADADGAAEAAETGHARRDFRIVRNDIDHTWQLDGALGDLDGAIAAQVFAAYVDAEFEADLAWAREHLGDDFALDQLPRTPAQRRADALLAIIRRAVAQPGDARSPEPLVSIVIDQETFERELARTCADPVDDVPDDPGRVDDVVCHTLGGDGFHPSGAVAAAMVGHVRRVVIDAAGNVIDVGRKRRLFTGTARDAAFIRTLLRDRGGTVCGCDIPLRRRQVDHDQSFGRGGLTDNDNSQVMCGAHNRLKEHGFIPRAGPDGTWTIVRPDGTPITPPA